MRTPITLSLGAVAGVLGAAVLWDRPATAQAKPTPASIKWEYRSVQKGSLDTDAERDLSTLGEDGWELVAVQGTSYTRYFLKRPKR